jgi:hypothetical protein
MTINTDDSNTDHFDATVAVAATASPDATTSITARPEEIIEPSDYAKFKTHKISWLPTLDGVRLEALRKQINECGQLSPILVDEKNTIWDGRARFEILKELGKPIRILRIGAAQGELHALAGNTNRDKTVLDDALMVKWVKEKGLGLIPLKDASKSKKTSAMISQWLIENQGWVRRSCARTIASYLELVGHLEGASSENREAVAISASVNAALKAFRPKVSTDDPEAKALKASKSIKAIVGMLNGIADMKLDGEARGEAEKAKQKLDDLLKLAPAA